MSVFMIISQPPPKQIPLTAAIMGFLPERVERPPKPPGPWKGRGPLVEAEVFHSV